MTKKLFTTKEIMNLLGLAQPTISKYVKKGMPVAGKVDFGKGNVYNLKDVTDWIKENAKPSGRPKKEQEEMIDDLPFTDCEEEEWSYEDFGNQIIQGLGYGFASGVEKNPYNLNVKTNAKGKVLGLDLDSIKFAEIKPEKPYSEVKPKVFKHRDMPVYVREDLHDKVKREALRHNVTMKKLVEDIVAYHLELK